MKSRWRRDFLYPFRPALGSTQRSIHWVPGLFPGGKAAGAWRLPPTPSNTEVKERVELYLYSPSRPSWPVLRFLMFGRLWVRMSDGPQWLLLLLVFHLCR